MKYAKEIEDLEKNPPKCPYCGADMRIAWYDEGKARWTCDRAITCPKCDATNICQGTIITTAEGGIRAKLNGFRCPECGEEK